MKQFSQFCAHSNLIQVLIRHLKVASSSSEICIPSGVLAIRRELTEAKNKHTKNLARHIYAGLRLYQLKVFLRENLVKSFLWTCAGRQLKPREMINQQKSPFVIVPDGKLISSSRNNCNSLSTFFLTVVNLFFLDKERNITKQKRVMLNIFSHKGENHAADKFYS